MRTGYEILVNLNPWAKRVEVLVRLWTGDAGSDLYLDCESVPSWLKTEDGQQSHPSFSLGMDDAQALMDGLWQCGLRPTEGTGSAGALAATQKHLEDMRELLLLGCPHQR
jgi:hypothetical protein